jgi:hypothetical protein
VFVSAWALSLSLSVFFGFFFEGFFSAVESDLIAQSAEESRGGEAGKVSLLGLGLSKRGLSPLPALCLLSNFLLDANPPQFFSFRQPLNRPTNKVSKKMNCGVE